jgi:hypothetical protein
VVQVDTLTLDASKPTTVPGALTTTIRSHKRTNRCEYNILYVPRLQAFQIECLHANGDVEFPFIFEHLAIQWIPTGYTKEALALAKKGQAA